MDPSLVIVGHDTEEDVTVFDLAVTGLLPAPREREPTFA
jgi:hypothetical protein